jgi:putative endonuclease
MRSVPRVVPRSPTPLRFAGRSGTKWGFLRYTNCVYYVYILELQDNSFYIGYSSDLKQRVSAHIAGEAKYTKSRGTYSSLLFYAAFRLKSKALQFEKYLKSSSGFAFRNKHFL